MNIPWSEKQMKTEKVDARMYLILREDLAYKYIQGGHALAQFALEYREQFEKWNNQYLINLSVFNGLALDELKWELLDKELNDFSYFIEPDLKSELGTAICIFENGDGKVKEALSRCGMSTK